MSRIGWPLVTAAFSVALLVAFGCERAATPRATSTPAPLPAGTELLTEARQILLEGLADTDPTIRTRAVEAIATTGDLRLMPRVQKLLSDESVPVRFNAALAVGDLEYALARNDVSRLLTDPNPNVVIAAAYAMTRLGEGDYYKVVCNAVASSDQTVRANAALLLGKSGRQEGLRFLYWTLRRDDSAEKVILQAAEAIAMLRDHRIYPKLWAQLISAYADDRVIGIRAMGALGTDEAKNALVTMLDDKVLEVRLAAAEQLGRLGEPMGEPNVLEVFEKDLMAGMDTQGQERIKVFTALAIGEIGTEPLAKYLRQLLQDQSKSVRLAAAKAALRRVRKR
jgi:HEAT repeat protein